LQRRSVRPDRSGPSSSVGYAEAADVDLSSPPRRPDGQRFYGGKRPPGTSSSVGSAAATDVDSSPHPRSTNNRHLLGGSRPPVSPSSVGSAAATDVDSSRHLPAAELILALRQNADKTTTDIAAELCHRFGWNTEAQRTLGYRLKDIREAQKDIVAQIRNRLPFEQSKANLRAFMRQLQDLTKYIASD